MGSYQSVEQQLINASNITVKNVSDIKWGYLSIYYSAYDGGQFVEKEILGRIVRESGENDAVFSIDTNEGKRAACLIETGDSIQDYAGHYQYYLISGNNNTYWTYINTSTEFVGGHRVIRVLYSGQEQDHNPDIAATPLIATPGNLLFTDPSQQFSSSLWTQNQNLAIRNLQEEIRRQDLIHEPEERERREREERGRERRERERRERERERERRERERRERERRGREAREREREREIERQFDRNLERGLESGLERERRGRDIERELDRRERDRERREERGVVDSAREERREERRISSELDKIEDLGCDSDQIDVISQETFRDLVNDPDMPIKSDDVIVFISENGSAQCYIKDDLIGYFDTSRIYGDCKGDEVDIEVHSENYCRKFYKLPHTGQWVAKGSIDEIKESKHNVWNIKHIGNVNLGRNMHYVSELNQENAPVYGLCPRGENCELGRMIGPDPIGWREGMIPRRLG